MFADSAKRRLLLAFASAPRSVAEAARLLGLDLRNAHYHVLRLAEAGLLRVVARRARGGRPVKLYRASAAAYLVPLHLLPRPPSEGLAEELRESLARSAQRTEDMMLFTVDPEGRPRARVVREPGSSPADSFESWRILALSPARLRALAADISALLDRYEAMTPEAGARSMLVHASGAPKLTSPGRG